MKKKLFPGKWSVTGGGVDVGEKSIDGMYRECREEIGVDLDPEKVELMMSLKRKNVFLDIYLDRENFSENDFKLQKEEVDKVEWLTREDITRLIENEDTPGSISKYFSFLCELIDEEKN